MPELIRLIIVVEGATEANFVRRILAPHLGRFGVVAALDSLHSEPRV
jgi:hypothetical protein